MREEIDSSLLENWINENITNKMVKTDSVVLFTGKLEGSTWEKFDDSVVSWGRKKFGDSYAIALWRDELMNLKDLFRHEG